MRYPMKSIGVTTYVLVVEPDPAFGADLADWLRQRNVVPVLTSSVHEAAITMHDALFMDSCFDGLLLNFKLPDAPGYRVVSEFRNEFPGRPIGIMYEQDDLCLKPWSRARGIPLFRKPFSLEALNHWLEVLQAPTVAGIVRN